MTGDAVQAGDFDYVCELLERHAGIVIDVDKQYLVELRLRSVCESEGVDSISTLTARLRTRPFCDLHREVVEALTIGETSFFRDGYPFEMLVNAVLPELLSRHPSREHLNIWSGACSSGQEPYSIGITIREYFPELSPDHVRILATDISRREVSRGRKGVYTGVEMNRGLPDRMRARYFRPEGGCWRVAPEVSELVHFLRRICWTPSPRCRPSMWSFSAMSSSTSRTRFASAFYTMSEASYGRADISSWAQRKSHASPGRNLTGCLGVSTSSSVLRRGEGVQRQ